MLGEAEQQVDADVRVKDVRIEDRGVRHRPLSPITGVSPGLITEIPQV
jgi:hypothetical protein